MGSFFATKHSGKWKIIRILLLVWLLPALACNMPVASTPSPEQAARETLTARLLAARTPAIQPDGAAAPSPLPPPPSSPQEATQAAPQELPTVPAPQSDDSLYTSRPGDTVSALALRFGVDPAQIVDPEVYPPEQLLPAGLKLPLPGPASGDPFAVDLLPDSEVIYSPSSVGFSVTDFVQSAGGFLAGYHEKVDNQDLSGAQIIQRVAEETSTNPRLLLAVLEYRAHWVFGSPQDSNHIQYPIGFYANTYAGLYKEITLASRQLTIGYYGWRSGKNTDLAFADHTAQRISPTVNGGTAALQYLFSTLDAPASWAADLYTPGSFMTLYAEKFGDPWQRAAAVEPELPDGLTQPQLELPFPPAQSWSFTGGPHAAWGVGSPWGGLDFAPANVEKGCTVSRFWATAAAPGLVTRSGNGQVIIDLDGDGSEQTGWVLLYLHMADDGRVPAGTYVNTDDPIGHPSCVGGVATGSHVHISRKYNGEWLASDGPLPFVLSGWQAWSGDRSYAGRLTRAGQMVTARPDGAATSVFMR